MSHMTKLDKANIRSAPAFIAAATELGLKTEQNAEITDWAHKTVKVDVAVRTLAGFDIGLKRDGMRYDMIGDFSMMRVPESLADKIKKGSRFATGTQLANRLLQLTTKHDLVAQYRRQGFQARVTEDAQQNIQVELSR